MGSVRERLQAFWDARYAAADYAYGTAPSEFLVASRAALPARGDVLCLADGEGRNGVWLAQQGFAVSAIDISLRGIDKTLVLAQQAGVALAARVADVTDADLGRERCDAIVSIMLHLPATPRRALHRRCLDALKPAGMLLYEAYGAAQLGRGTGGPDELALLPELDELLADFEDERVAIEHRFAGVRHIVEGRLHRGDGFVNQLIVRRSASP